MKHETHKAAHAPHAAKQAHFEKPEKLEDESKADYDARVEAAKAAHEKAQVDAEAKAVYDSEPHDISPENVIRERPTRVLVEYADGHALQFAGDSIQEYQGLTPASSDQWAGVIELRLKVNTSGYQPRTLDEVLNPD